MKLAIVNIDGTIADNSERIALADQSGYPAKGEGADRYWAMAEQAGLVLKDKVIAGSLEAMTALAEQGFEIIYMSSRPARLDETTRYWLSQHGFEKYGPDLILKPHCLRTRFKQMIKLEGGRIKGKLSLWKKQEKLTLAIPLTKSGKSFSHI